MKPIKPGINIPPRNFIAQSTVNLTQATRKTNEKYVARNKNNIKKVEDGLEKSSKRAIDYRNYLDNITKTDEYLQMKAKTLFGRKGFIP